MDTTPTRTCSRCGETKPHDNEHFTSRGAVCRVCHRERKREAKRRNPELHAKTLAAWKAKKRAEDPDFFARYQRDWAKTNPTKAAEYRKNWRTSSPENYAIYKRRTGKSTYQKMMSDPNARNTFRVNSAKSRALSLGLTEHFTLAELLELICKSGEFCYYCGEKLSGKFDVDHMTPLSRGGSNKIDNICIACETCNGRKNAKTAEEYLEKIKGETQ